MQRAMLILTLVSISVAIVWAYTGKILMAFGQDPEISIEVGLYARWMIPGIFAYGLYEVSTNPKHRHPGHAKLWAHCFASYSCVLDLGIQIWPRQQRCCFSKFYLLLDQYIAIGTLC